MVPNDYEKCLAEREADRAKEKAEAKAKELEDLEKYSIFALLASTSKLLFSQHVFLMRF